MTKKTHEEATSIWLNMGEFNGKPTYFDHLTGGKYIKEDSDKVFIGEVRHCLDRDAVIKHIMKTGEIPQEVV